MRRRFKGQRTPQQIYESMERSRIRGEELEAAAVQTQFSKTRMLKQHQHHKEISGMYA